MEAYVLGEVKRAGDTTYTFEAIVPSIDNEEMILITNTNPNNKCIYNTYKILKNTEKLGDINKDGYIDTRRRKANS